MGGVFFCQVWVSSPVWGQEAGVCEHCPCTAAAECEPGPEAAPHTAAPPAARSAAPADCSSLESKHTDYGRVTLSLH